MEAGATRFIAQTAAERMRIATESARERFLSEAEDELQQLEDAIAKTVTMQASRIDKLVAYSANMGKDNTTYVYSERISTSLRSLDEVDFIKAFSDTVTGRLLVGLQAGGFNATARQSEVVDYRDKANSPPEYYDSSILVSW